MPQPKFKIALCISGEPRNAMASFPYIFESFLREDLRYETDVFIHSRKPYRAINLYQPLQCIIDPTDENLLYRQTISKLNITSKNALLKLNTFNGFTLTSNILKNQVLMYDGIKKCQDLASSTKKYDLYIRCRPDIIFRNQISFNHIINDILIEKKYDMLIPDIYYGDLDMDDDKLAIGNPKSMESYTNILTNLTQLINQTDDLVSEKWVKQQLINNNIKVNKYWIGVDLIRKFNLKTYITNNNFYNEE